MPSQTITVRFYGPFSWLGNNDTTDIFCISQAHGRHQKSQQRWANSFGERPGIARP